MYRSSMTKFLISSLGILMACLFVTTLILAYEAWSNFVLAGHIAALTRADRTVFGAIVTVRSEVPVVSTALIAEEDPKPLMTEALNAAAQAVGAALEALQSLELPARERHLGQIGDAWSAVLAQLPVIEDQAVRPRGQRDLVATDGWRDSVNATIDALNEGSVAVGSAGQLDDPVVAEMVQIRRTAWTIRDRYGLQCSLLRVNVDRGQLLSPRQAETWAGYRAVYQSAWRALDDVQLGPAVADGLREQIRIARRTTEDAQAKVDGVIARLDGSGRPAMAGADWTSLCDGPFDAILSVSRLAQSEATRHAEAIRAKSFRLLLVAGLDLSAVIAFGVFAVINVQKRLARPMRLLTGTITRLSQRDFAEAVPATGHPDELGSMAEALESLRTNAMEAERLQLAMSRFTADASHQMRTPLSILRAHIAVLAGLIPSGHDAFSSLTDIKEAADRLQRLLIQLVSLARAEGTPLPEGDAERFDLHALVRDITAKHIPQALEAGIELHLEATKQSFRCSANATLISEILANLLDNAIRYSGQGDTVGVRLSRRRALFVIEIEDDGPGIPETEREKVFTRFYRLSRDQNRPGSGLGLAIVQSLASALNAEVTITAGRSGRGTRARVEF